ncbi:MAG: transcriptional regulator [Alphaproteobacteria bacterium CG_4_10_14_0_8_um_filter_53_9]|nr:MAG: transcriptional regulator [Alphaproteobacteria bacterium CG_4_10_14_0_8_um_filter_53_9]
MNTTSTKDPIDLHVGQRLKLRRTMLGLSQEKVGEAVGVTFQMIQKYEKGACRVGASRLQQLARVVDVPVAWFFEEFTPQGKQSVSLVAEEKTTLDENVLTKKETMTLLKAYYNLSEEQRKHVLAMVKGLSENAAPKSSK